MPTLESVITAIYDFVKRLVRTYRYSIFSFKTIILRLNRKVENDLLNPHLFLVISFLFFVPTCTTIEYNTGNALSILKSFKTFYGDYNLLLELTIISPLIIGSEAIIYFSKKIIKPSNGKEKVFWGDACRYILGSLFLTCYLFRLLDSVLQNDFNITVFRGYEIHMLLSLMSIVFVLLSYNIGQFKWSLFKKRWTTRLLLIMPFLMFIGLLSSFRVLLRAYYMKLSPNKIHIISGEPYNILRFKLRDTAIQKSIDHQSNLNNINGGLRKDSVELVTTVIFKYDGNNECILNLKKFRLNVEYKPKHHEPVIIWLEHLRQIFQKSSIDSLDSLSFALQVPTRKLSQNENFVQIKANELKMVELKTTLSNKQFELLRIQQDTSKKYSSKKFTIEGSLYPECGDNSNYINEKMAIKLDTLLPQKTYHPSANVQRRPEHGVLVP